MDDEPSKLQEEACGARPQGRTPLWQMFREPDLANVVGSLIEVASGNETFLGAGQPPIRRSPLPSRVYPLNASSLRGTYVLGSHLSL